MRITILLILFCLALVATAQQLKVQCLPCPPLSDLPQPSFNPKACKDAIYAFFSDPAAVCQAASQQDMLCVDAKGVPTVSSTHTLTIPAYQTFAWSPSQECTISITNSGTSAYDTHMYVDRFELRHIIDQCPLCNVAGNGQPSVFGAVGMSLYNPNSKLTYKVGIY